MVGPNGSGKSNVIDAMLFVFGKKAKQVGPQYLSVNASQLYITSLATAIPDHRVMACFCLQLRLSKVSELIHNSSNHRNLESAKVSVHFTEIIDAVSLKHPLLDRSLCQG